MGVIVARNNHVLVLVHLTFEKYDFAGNKFPDEGFVKAREFSRDNDIRNGIFGYEWGVTGRFRYEDVDLGNWSVVKTVRSDNYIFIDRREGTVKFESGIILKTGTLKQAGNFISNIRTDYTHSFESKCLYFKNKEIAGTKEWYKNISLKGCYCG